MTDKNSDAQDDSDLEDTISKVVTLSTDASTKDRDTDSGPLNESEESTNAGFSLGRLEHDLKQLQSKWCAVERQISRRDERIGELKCTIDSDRQKISALEADLESMSSNNGELAVQLASAEHKIGNWREKGDAFERDLQSRDADLHLAQNQHDVLLQGNKKLEADLEQQKNDSEASVEAANAFREKNTELQTHIQELQDYIDGRKRDWEKMQSQLKEYENTIKGMSDSVVAHEEIVAGKEEEKAALAQTIMGLERDLAALKGQQSEREANRLELQETLDKQTRELGSLSGEATKLNKQIEELLRERDSSVESVHELQQELDEQNANSSSLEERLATEKARFEDQSSRIVDLEKSLKYRGDAESDLRQKLVAAETELEEASSKAAKEEIRAIELDAMLSEVQAERRNLEKDVQAQRELIESLEGEVKNSQDNLNSMDRSVNRLSALGSEIRKLDLQIDDRWYEQSPSLFEDSQDLFEYPDDVFIAPKELLAEDEELTEHVLVLEHADAGEETRYPLTQKEITIGRSTKSDIRLLSKQISRVHARIKVNGENVFIEDAGSTNGFLVNSIQATRQKLAHGDTVQFGKEKFRYLTVS